MERAELHSAQRSSSGRAEVIAATTEGGFMPDSTRVEHVRQFLAPVAAEPTVKGVARALMRRARSDAALATLFVAIQKELGDGQDLLDQRQSDILDRVKTDDELDVPSAPDWLRPAVTAAYVRARDTITPQVATRILSDPEKALRHTQKAVRGLEPGFVGELIVEAALQQRDTEFARR
jgi:hypothetical protein